MAQVTDVERLYSEIQAIKTQLALTGDLSSISNFETFAAKSLLLAAASYFERRITDQILEFARTASGNEVLVEFIKNQAISRKYHTMFDWEANHLNRFFSLFGPKTKQQLSKETSEGVLKKQVEAFISINSERNQLVHQNYASFILTTTTDDLWNRYIDAVGFCDWLQVALSKTVTPH